MCSRRTKALTTQQHYFSHQRVPKHHAAYPCSACDQRESRNQQWFACLWARLILWKRRQAKWRGMLVMPDEAGSIIKHDITDATSVPPKGGPDKRVPPNLAGRSIILRARANRNLPRLIFRVDERNRFLATRTIHLSPCRVCIIAPRPGHLTAKKTQTPFAPS